jgi:hypothetical protein
VGLERQGGLMVWDVTSPRNLPPNQPPQLFLVARNVSAREHVWLTWAPTPCREHYVCQRAGSTYLPHPARLHPLPCALSYTRWHARAVVHVFVPPQYSTALVGAANITAAGSDLAPEQVKWIPAADSPTGELLLLASNEFSSTLSM